MNIDFQKEKERIELKHSTYVGSIGIYMEFSEKVEDTAFKYYLYNGIREDEAVNFISSMFSSIVEEQMKDIAPITKTIEEAKTIEVLHNLIKNNGQDFNLSNEQLELVEKLK